LDSGEDGCATQALGDKIAETLECHQIYLLECAGEKQNPGLIPLLQHQPYNFDAQRSFSKNEIPGAQSGLPSDHLMGSFRRPFV